MWGNLLLGNPFHMSNSTSYTSYTSSNKKKNTKTTHLGKPGSKNILSEYSFLKTYLKNNKERSGGGKPIRAADLLCVSLSTSSLFGIILLDASLQWSVRFEHVPGTSRTLFLEAWRDGLNERKMGEGFVVYR